MSEKSFFDFLAYRRRLNETARQRAQRALEEASKHGTLHFIVERQRQRRVEANERKVLELAMDEGQLTEKDLIERLQIEEAKARAKAFHALGKRFEVVK